jgi:chemotaxis signal transduction protein
VSNVLEAWLLECGGGVTVAVPAINMLHVVEETSRCFRVPMAPPHCDHVLVWQERVLPIVDIAKLLSPLVAVSVAHKGYCVVGWCGVDDISEYGVIGAATAPRRVIIRDDMSVAPSAQLASQWPVAVGFFVHAKDTIAIVDPARLFGSQQLGLQHHNERMQSQSIQHLSA